MAKRGKQASGGESLVNSDASGSYGTIPQFDASMRFADMGSSGLRVSGGWVREEYLPQLVGRQAARVYREMGDTSPIVAAVLFAITSVMRKVEWRVQAANETPEAEEKVLFVKSLMDDMSHTFSDFVTEALSMLKFGYAPHEIVYKVRGGPKPFGSDEAPSKHADGKIGWAKLPLRGQETVLKWFLSPNGDILGLTQQPWMGPLVDLPMEKMLLFRPSQHKNNPEGYSILRPAYRSYYFIKRLEEQEAILFERMSGIPVVRVPNSLIDAASGTGPQAAKAQAALTQWKKIVTNIRIDEQMGLLIPSDVFPSAGGAGHVPMYDFKLETPASNKTSVDANVPITRHKMDILTSTLTDFISMGHNTRGSQNLGETKMDMFMQAVEGWLNGIASVINDVALPRLWALNGMDVALMPKIIPDMAQRVDLDQLSNYILRMAQSGAAMFPDQNLENYLREAAGLPESVEGVE